MDMHQWALECIKNIYNEQFDEAHDAAKKIIRKYSDHPAGYFFYAITVDSWMTFQRTDGREDEFYRYCELAIEKGEKTLIKNPKNAWAKFFIGGAEGAKGSYESKYERWITAFRYGWKGVSILSELKKKQPEIIDIDYGIGMYNYWRSAMTMKMRWLPGIEDKREQSIRQLYRVMDTGTYSKDAAAEKLIPILHNEKRFEDALKIAAEMLEKYPQNIIFKWGMAESQFGLKRYKEAQLAFADILTRVEARKMENHVSAVLCHFWLAKCYYQMGMYIESLAECNRMEYYKLSQKNRKYLSKEFSDAAELKKITGKAARRRHR
jgi:tetratricopeptide (TPR) repeat protein